MQYNPNSTLLTEERYSTKTSLRSGENTALATRLCHANNFLLTTSKHEKWTITQVLAPTNEI